MIEINEENQELFIGQNLMARNVQPEPTGSWVLAALRPAYISCEGENGILGASYGPIEIVGRHVSTISGST